MQSTLNPSASDLMVILRPASGTAKHEAHQTRAQTLSINKGFLRAARVAPRRRWCRPPQSPDPPASPGHWHWHWEHFGVTSRKLPTSELRSWPAKTKLQRPVRRCFHCGASSRFQLGPRPPAEKSSPKEASTCRRAELGRRRSCWADSVR